MTKNWHFLMFSVGVIFASFMLSVVASSMMWLGDGEHPSDEKLIANFQEHKAALDSLLKMSMEDSELKRVDDNWTRPEDPRTIGVNAERISEYRKLFRKAGVPRGFYAFHEDGIFEFIASSRGLAIGGSSKGYAFYKSRPALVVNNLDEYLKNLDKSRTFPAFRHIEGNWYLFLYAD